VGNPVSQAGGGLSSSCWITRHRLEGGILRGFRASQPQEARPIGCNGWPHCTGGLLSVQYGTPAPRSRASMQGSTHDRHVARACRGWGPVVAAEIAVTSAATGDFRQERMVHSRGTFLTYLARSMASSTPRVCLLPPQTALRAR
jgi:hypothetical protein